MIGRYLLIATLALGAPEVLERFDIVMSAQPSSTGQYVHGRDFAAYAWRTDVPSAEDAPMIIDLGGQSLRLAIFCDGAFTDGREVFDFPVRWAYVRYYQESWNGTHWTGPDGTLPSADVYKGLQHTVDVLKQHYTTVEILDALDRSPFDVPAEGAPDEE
jgi:hypothetical protein